MQYINPYIAYLNYLFFNNLIYQIIAISLTSQPFSIIRLDSD